MISTTLKHDRKQAIQQKERAKRQKEESERKAFRKLVIGEAYKTAVKFSHIRDLPKEFNDLTFYALSPKRRVAVLESYIIEMQELGDRLAKEYADLPATQDKLKDISDRIDAATEMIFDIEIDAVSAGFELDD